MPTVSQQIIVEYTPAQMFELVDDVNRYSEFLPWCSGSEVSLSSPTETHAKLYVNYHGIKTHFGTHNRKVFPQEMTLHLQEGPFRQLEGRWRFIALGDFACKIDFQLQYEFSSTLLGKALSPVFHHIASTFVEAFVQRAAVIYPKS